MQTLKGDGYAEYYEFGPGRVLAGLLSKCDPAAKCTPIDKVADVQ
jgi:malonyl CoA-acyl carrier protein transacylase